MWCTTGARRDNENRRPQERRRRQLRACTRKHHALQPRRADAVYGARLPQSSRFLLKPPPKNASTKPEVELGWKPETKPSTTEAAALSVADENAARRNVNASSKIAWCDFQTAALCLSLRTAHATRQLRPSLAPRTALLTRYHLDKSSLGLDDHVNAAYRNALSLEQPQPKTIKGTVHSTVGQALCILSVTYSSIFSSHPIWGSCCV